MSRFASIVIALTTVFSASSRAEEAVRPYVLDVAIQKRIHAIVKDYKPQYRALKLTEQRENKNIGNFGMVTSFDQQMQYVQQDTGLWQSRRADAESGSPQDLNLTLCGLVPLLRIIEKIKIEATSAAPLGRTFIPFGIRSTSDARTRATSFLTESNEICAPAPGASFQYEVEYEAEVVMLGHKSTSDNKVEVSCQVGKDASPARGLAPELPGDMLPVTCQRKALRGQNAKLEYAFLKDFGLYLLLAESGKIATTKMQYKAAEHGEAVAR